MEPAWMHKGVKCEQNAKRILKKTGLGNMHMKMAKQDETQTHQSLILVSTHRIVVSTFPDLLRMCPKWYQQTFEIEACGCPWEQQASRIKV